MLLLFVNEIFVKIFAYYKCTFPLKSLFYL